VGQSIKANRSSKKLDHLRKMPHPEACTVIFIDSGENYIEKTQQQQKLYIYLHHLFPSYVKAICTIVAFK
jgi:hypothetical protein